jgi:hypothetical protein
VGGESGPIGFQQLMEALTTVWESRIKAAETYKNGRMAKKTFLCVNSKPSEHCKEGYSSVAKQWISTTMYEREVASGRSRERLCFQSIPCDYGRCFGQIGDR